MAKKKKAKRLEPTQSTVNKSAENRATSPARKKKKSNINLKQILIVGALALAMLAFIMQPLIRNMTSSGTTTDTNNTTMNEPKAEAPPGGVEPQFRKDGELTFLSSNKTDSLQGIDIEIVRDDASIQQGLMWRKSMLENRGMLFVMPEMKTQSFWMKNTHIPLDIIFINHNRQIVTIRKNTIPFSEKNVKSSQNAKYVLEVNAGYSDKFGIKKGDFVKWQ